MTAFELTPPTERDSSSHVGKSGKSRGESWRARAMQRLQRMYSTYGRGPDGAICGSCAHFRRYRQGATWFKCSKARVSSSTATDWRARWPACGAFEEAWK